MIQVTTEMMFSTKPGGRAFAQSSPGCADNDRLISRTLFVVANFGMVSERHLTLQAGHEYLVANE